MICTSCAAGKIEKRRVPYNFLGEKIGLFDALVCDKCDETLFEPEAADKIEEEVRKKGLWGLRARTKISKSRQRVGCAHTKDARRFLIAEERAGSHNRAHR